MSFIFLNLFIAIILESFDQSQAEDGLHVGEGTITKFKEFWSKFDPKGKGFIPVRKLSKLINLIIDEEIKQIYRLKQDVQSGSLDISEKEYNTFMFNLHKHNDLQPLAAIRKDRIFKSMEEGIGHSQVIDTNHSSEHNESSPNKKSDMVSDSDEESEESDNDFAVGLSKHPGLETAQAQSKIRRMMMNDFIGALHIPVYMTLKFYNFHDVVEALARCLFQNLLDQASKEAEHIAAYGDAPAGTLIDEFEKDDDQSEGSAASVSSAGSAKAQEFALDAAGLARETKTELKLGDFELVLMKLEQKSALKDIFKCQEMKKLRSSLNNRIS